ncbi:hypothetical protein [Bacillus pinisoli]|uniref:hypothetical protein n=1 Tax=Bacillus pinisoli TaxID=2901866 RepID=UPI001FF50801|nr:hypothetical protein [Bacillus pinisoli]
MLKKKTLKFIRKSLIIVVLILISTSCNSLQDLSKNEITTGSIVFEGEGNNWKAVYTFDAERYQKYKGNYFTIINIGNEKTDLKDIYIELTSDTINMQGIVGDMDTKEFINEDGFQEITFVVGTVNENTYAEDKYKLLIKFNNKEDILTLEKKEDGE